MTAMTTPPRDIHFADTDQIPAQHLTEDGFDEGPLSQFNAPREQQPGYVWNDEEAPAPPKQRYMRGCGIFALVVLLLVAVLVAVGVWAGQKLWQAGEDAIFSLGDGTAVTLDSPVTDAAAPPVPDVDAAEVQDSVGAVQAPDTNWVTDQARRLAFTTTTATEHGLTGADPAVTYDQITGLCTALTSGAEPASTLFGFVNDNSTATTAAPMAKITATGMGIQCPEQYTAAAQSIQLMAPGIEIPDVSTFSWVP